MPTKHTPGPWVWGTWQIFPEDWPEGGHVKLWTLVPPRGWMDPVLCQGPYERKIPKHPSEILTPTGHDAEGIAWDNPADACLIAEAPELLEAAKNGLKAMEREFNRAESYGDFYDELERIGAINRIAQAHTAITKAEGEKENG